MRKAVWALVLLGTAIGAIVYWAKGRETPPDFVRLAGLEAAGTASPFEPAPLTGPPPTEEHLVRDEEGRPIQCPTPVNVASLSETECFVCNYTDLFWLDLRRDRAVRVVPPAECARMWVPTGLAYWRPGKLLWIATYTRSSLIALDLSNLKQPRLKKVIQAPQLNHPEGVAVSRDGQWIAAADYDGGSLLVFDADGKLRMQSTVPYAHGVAFLEADGQEPSLVVTGLSPPGIYKFDLKGALMARKSGVGWTGPDQYLYPTSVVADEKGRLATVDADSGQVSFLDRDIRELACFGGNGPGALCFNRPYGVAWEENGKILVTDTFKDRLVRVDVPSRSIQRVWKLRERGALAQTQPSGEGPLMRPSLGQHVGFLTDAVKPVVLKRYGRERADPSRPVRIALPLLAGLKEYSVGYPAYCGLVVCRKDGKHKLLTTLGAGPLFGSHGLQYLEAKNVACDGEDYLLVSSPQGSCALVIWNGLCAPILLDRDFWLVDDLLIGDTVEVSVTEVVRMGAARIKAFTASAKAEDPLEAVRKAFFPALQEREFLEAASGVFETEEGKPLRDLILKRATAQDLRREARLYLKRLPGTKARLDLPAICLAHMILREE